MTLKRWFEPAIRAEQYEAPSSERQKFSRSRRLSTTRPPTSSCRPTWTGGLGPSACTQLCSQGRPCCSGASVGIHFSGGFMRQRGRNSREVSAFLVPSNDNPTHPRSLCTHPPSRDPGISKPAALSVLSDAASLRSHDIASRGATQSPWEAG